jgi:hypothetical protein
MSHAVIDSLIYVTYKTVFVESFLLFTEMIRSLVLLCSAFIFS